jgi:hypothetical protein
MPEALPNASKTARRITEDFSRSAAEIRKVLPSSFRPICSATAENNSASAAVR